MAIEIYPRLLTGPVIKNAQSARRPYLEAAFPHLDPHVRNCAAFSEDAFDAAVSALIIDKHRDALLGLPGSRDAIDRLEGQIWHS